MDYSVVGVRSVYSYYYKWWQFSCQFKSFDILRRRDDVAT